MSIKKNNHLDVLGSNERIYIFGAGDVGREVFCCLSEAPFNASVNAFLVSHRSLTDPEDIEGIPVLLCDDNSLDRAGLVIVAVLEKYRGDICQKLDELGYQNRIIMTFESDCFSEVRAEWFKKRCELRGYPFCFELAENKSNEFDLQKLKVYVTRSSKDKPIKQKYEKKQWEEEIYAGAALGDIGDDVTRDDRGQNISLKNRMYCELTAMYWIWKNTDHEYVGLSHYRRRFDFTDKELSAVTTGDIDVVVTIPVVNVPDVRFMYGKNHETNDWDVMREVVRKQYPEYIESFDYVERSRSYIPYNMFIMKRKVFLDYCEWLFSILEKCESEIGTKEDAYQNRYIGFLAERLMTVYIYHHRNDLKVFFCNKRFLE